MNAATLARYEYKYVMSSETMDRFQAAIRPYCTMDEYGAWSATGFYTINSLYFDDDRYRLYWDTENNVSVRAKLRVRSYGQTEGGIVKFEVKRRINDLVVKTTACLPLQNWESWLSPAAGIGRAAFTPTSSEALDLFLVMTRTMGARAKMLVRYQRLAYRSTIDNYVRITFDRHMIHQPMAKNELSGYSERWKAMDDPGSLGCSRSNVLLELKFVKSAPVWLVDTVRRFGLVRQGYSKYACAVRRSVFERDAGRDLAPAFTHGRLRSGAAWTF